MYGNNYRKLTVGVPVVVAVSPWQLRDVDEGWEEVEERPRDDHVVVDAD